MPLVAVQDGLFYGAFATRVVCAAGSVRTSCGVHPELQRSHLHWVSARTAWLLPSRLHVALPKLPMAAIE